MMYFLPSPSARMTTSSAMSHQIRERLLGAAEIANSKPEKQRDHNQAKQESRQIKRALAAENAPAETVDHAHHRIEAVPEAPFIRNHGARESHGGDIEPELDDERDEVAEVAVFHVKGGDEKRRAE